ncbi:hypothetical protein [Paenibacillus luteus]|nr:hypothetical protein [Paenibacillus luteus]
MNVIKLSMARRKIKVVQLWLIEQPRSHLMEAAMQIGFYKAAQLVRSRE